MKKILLTLVVFMATIAVNAEQVSKQQALQKAQQFMPNKHFGEVKAFARSEGSSDGEPFYIFNVENDGGFVIVSGDDRTEAILGYSDKGHINMDNMPKNLRYWLDSYAQQITSLSSDYRPNTRSSTRSSMAAIPPLIQTQWDQGYPYNLMCPVFGDMCFTGCTATAIAQIMYYHKWPKGETKSIPEYTTRTNKINLPELPPTAFKWNNMKTSYNGEEDKESQNAVAELMRYVGQAMSMDYNTPDGSAAWPIPDLMKAYFGYSRKFRSVHKDDYDYSEWVEMLYGALADKKPILYSGDPIDPEGSGHEFVIDGYDGVGLFHVNWGWGGWCDGFFALEAADPYASGIEGKSSTSGFCSNQTAILYLMPPFDEGEATVGELFYWTTPSSKIATVQRASNYKELTELVIPASILIGGEKYDVKGVEKYAFINASKLTSVKFSDGLECIGEMSFGSEKLTKIELPASLKTIGKDAFSPVSSLVVYSYVENPVEIDIAEGAFNSNSILIIPDGCKDKYTSLDCWKRVGVILTTSEYEELKKEESDNSPIISFADPKVKEIILNNYPKWDVSEDGEISEAEAKQVTDLGKNFHSSAISSFDELRYFTGLTTLPVGAFAGCESLISITLPDNITKLGGWSFQNCSSLESVLLPEQLETISESAFVDCISLKSLIIPENVTTIANDAFRNCNQLVSIILPEHIKIIGNNAFEDCSSLTSVTIQCYPSSIGYGIFEDCNIKEVTFDYSSAFKVFSGMPSIEKVTLTDKVTKIEENAFRNCSGLVSINIPNSVKTIESYAFMGCISLTALVIPEHVSSIGGGAFEGCDNLYYIIVESKEPFNISEYFWEHSWPERFDVSLIVPDGCKEKYASADHWKKFVRIIEKSDFDKIKLSPIITFADPKVKERCIKHKNDFSEVWSWDVNGDGELAEAEAALVSDLGMNFYGSDISSFEELRYFTGLTSIPSNSFGRCVNLSSISLPESLESIGSYAFNGLSKLKSIIIPSKVKTIGNEAFRGCISLESVTMQCHPSYPEYSPFSDCINIKEVTFDCESAYPLFCNMPSLVKVKLTNKVKTIEDNAFYGCSGLTSIVLPNGLKSLGHSAFCDCSGLTSIKIPYNVKTIGTAAFLGTGLSSVIISGKNVEIGDFAFYSESLATLTVMDQNPFPISEFSFEPKESVILYVPYGSKKKYEEADYWRDFMDIVEIAPVLLGDANNDGRVDADDIEAITRYIMEGDDEGFIFKNADVNGDEKINAADIVEVVNIIKANK